MFRDILIRTTAVLALVFLAMRVGILVNQGAWAGTWHAHNAFWLMQFVIAVVVAGVAWTGGGATLWAPASTSNRSARAGSAVRGHDGAGQQEPRRSYVPAHLLENDEADALMRHSIDRICITVVVLFAAGQGLLLLALWPGP